MWRLITSVQFAGNLRDAESSEISWRREPPLVAEDSLHDAHVGEVHYL